MIQIYTMEEQHAIYPTYKIFDYHGYKDMVDTKDAIEI